MRPTRYIHRIIAAEVSSLTRYAGRLHYLPAVSDRDSHEIYDNVVCANKYLINIDDPLPDLTKDRDTTTVVLLDGVMNHSDDVESLLTAFKSRAARTTRIVAVCYNPYLSWLYIIATYLRLRRGPLPTAFPRISDIIDLAQLSGFQITLKRNAAYFPFHLLGLGNVINAACVLIPFVKHLSLVTLVTLRPIIEETGVPSVSIIVPARNEAGNIENAVTRMPTFDGAKTEIIFVEGHSTDDTWARIIALADRYKGRHTIRAVQQNGKGKVDAVRLGFSLAENDVLAILDADLTMPPEMLTRYYDAYREGKADFINGNRLLYDMEGDAMRFLNRLGNIFFAKSLSFLLDTRLGDTLCGTKVLSAHDYKKMIAWREDFGDFDPFGDFELLFPAAILGLGIINVPIKYRARTYGTTNISRFYHGLVLLKMVTVGLLRVKLGKTSLPTENISTTAHRDVGKATSIDANVF